MKPRAVLAILKWLVAFMWPTAVWAAPITFTQSFSDVPGLAWFGVAFLSTLGGVTSLLIRVSAQVNGTPEGQEPKPIRKPWLLAGSHMAASWVAGSLFFLYGLHTEMQFFLLAAAVLVASFLGARAIEWAAQRIIGLPPTTPGNP